MQRILSGIRPTGIIHLGNYLGAIHQWVKTLHDTTQAIDHLFCIVDLHAFIDAKESENLHDNSRLMAATYIACGLDPKKCHIFAQSDIPEVVELSWIFSCLTPMGWLNRMTQFKDKAGKNVQNVCLGLYAYPVLMAADILVYKATHVPVGEDQKQHVELTRDIAGAFNRRFGVQYFTLPEPVIKGPATRVMSLRDGSAKMSKSDISDLSRIHLTDDADTIAKKIKKAKTDTLPIEGDFDAMKDRLEARNLINMLAVLSNKTPQIIANELQNQTFSVLKEALIEALHREILPIGQRIKEYLRDEHAIEKVLKDGKDYAQSLASKNLREIYKIVGIQKDKS